MRWVVGGRRWSWVVVVGGGRGGGAACTEASATLAYLGVHGPHLGQHAGDVLRRVAARREEEWVADHRLGPLLDARRVGLLERGLGELHVRWLHDGAAAVLLERRDHLEQLLVRRLALGAVVDHDHRHLPLLLPLLVR